MSEVFVPTLINLPKVEGKGGALSYIEEGGDLQFNLRRIYWIYGTAQATTRGNHCHKFSHRIIVCVNGHVEIELENTFKENFSYTLAHPHQVVYIPPRHWMKLKLSEDAILVSGSSHLFEDDVTISNYEDFIALGQL